MIEQIDNELITKKPGSDSMENTEQIEVDKQASSTLEQLEYNFVGQKSNGWDSQGRAQEKV